MVEGVVPPQAFPMLPGTQTSHGLRNVAKARVKDTDGRLQRNHFGKQRLSVLAKGLGRTLAPPRQALREEAIAARIPFAHAQKTSHATESPEQRDLFEVRSAYSQQRTPRGPSNRQTSRAAPSSTSSRSSRSSKITSELDSTERTFF